MKCIHDLQEQIDATLDTAFEVYGRAVFFEDGEEADAVNESISSLIDAWGTVDECLEATEDDEDADEEDGDISGYDGRVDVA